MVFKRLYNTVNNRKIINIFQAVDEEQLIKVVLSCLLEVKNLFGHE